MFAAPVAVAQSDIERFKESFPMNARPLQPIHRQILPDELTPATEILFAGSDGVSNGLNRPNADYRHESSKDWGFPLPYGSSAGLGHEFFK